MPKIEKERHSLFQFPLGIRWCSDYGKLIARYGAEKTNFNSPWELDGVRTRKRR